MASYNNNNNINNNNNSKTEADSNIKCSFNELPKIIVREKELLLDWREDNDKLCTKTHNDIELQLIRQCSHNESEFSILCFCKYCLDYRKDILQLFNDHIKTQKIWKMFEKAISKLYLPLVENASPEVLQMYDYLITHYSNWLVNGIINKVKLKHIDFLLDFPLTEKMIVVIFSAILIEDDPYQLFQLMSFLVECFVKVYATTLTTNYKIDIESKTPAKYLLTYVLNGYKNLLSIAGIISELLFEFERNYLEHFKCSWLLLNKKMYHKYCYSILRAEIPEFLLKLKSEVSNCEYKTLTAQLKEFEMDMGLTEDAWEEIKSFLSEYQNSFDNKKRKKRINFVLNLFNVINKNHPININSPFSERKSTEILWEQMVDYIKKNGTCGVKKHEISKLIVDENDCQYCQNELRHKQNFCTCIQCLHSAEPHSFLETKAIEDILCIKCSFMRALPDEDHNFVTKLSKMSLDDNSNYSNTMANIEGEEIEKEQEECTGNIFKPEVYHYCWAVFKHLKDTDIKPYQSTIMEADRFCKNCHRTSCLLAMKILNNEISDEIAKYLIKHYQPFRITNEEIMQMLPKIWLCFRKGHFPHDHYDEDFIIKSFWIFVISAYATCFAYLDIKQYIPDMGCFLLTSNDIESVLINKKSNLQSTDLLEFIEKIINLLQTNRKAVNSNTKMLNDVNKNMKMNTLLVKGSDENVENLNILSKETSIKNDISDKYKNTVKTSCKWDTKDCKEHEKPTKDSNSGKPPCFHEKEYRSNRKNETRDRLREKLKKLVTNNKKSLPLPVKSGNPDDSNLQNIFINGNEAIKKTKSVCKNNSGNNKPVNTESKIPALMDDKYVCEDKGAFKMNVDEKWVKDALSYIEGSQNKNGVIDNKKAAKRQKQKLKKEEFKRIEELKDLRSKFHEVYFKEFMAKKERRNEQLSKKKDKKRILDLENSVKKLSKVKLRFEKDILELISVLKSINSEFKFTYLPTKQQQEDFLQNNCQRKDTTSNFCHSHDTKKEVVNSKPDIAVSNYQKNNSMGSLNAEQDTIDASKRIVTIRRVNMPNNNEPQVTVTAKGSSPDEDKVLYTFINGRLVQRDCGNASDLDKASRSINFTQLSEIKNVLFQNNDIMSCIGYNPNNNKNNLVIKTKTQLKKERKMAKKLAENLNKERHRNLDLETYVHNNKNEITLQNLNHCVFPNTKEVGNSIHKCKENFKCHQNISKNLKQEKNISKSQNNLRNNVKQKTNSCPIEHITSTKCDKIVFEENNTCGGKINKMIKKTVKDEKKKNIKVHNMNILKNNQFNLLNIEDSESLTEESEPDIDTSICNKLSLNVKPSVNTITSNSKNKNSIIKCKSSGLTISSSSNKSSELTISSSSKKKAKCKDRIKKNCPINVKENAQYSSNYINVSKPPEKNVIGLAESMNNLNINTNNENLNKKSNVTNISIMEQLKRGIQVENLTLPPGITLTKVNPAKAEELKAKSGSIHNLSQQILPQQSSLHSLFSADFLPPTVNNYVSDTNGLIMVDNINTKSVSTKKLPKCVNDCENKSKIKKRKNKNKRRSNSETNISLESKNVASNIITLRNPMFYLNKPESLPYRNLTERLPQTSDSQIDQPATIIRNKNGMFTIRNPVLYQNMAESNFINNYDSFSPNYYTSMRSYLQDGDNNSHLSDNTSMNSGKCMSAIGSEMKSAQQKQFALFHNPTLKNPNTADSYGNGLNSFIPHDSLFYNNYGNYCGATSTISNNNMFGNSENISQNSLNKNSANIQSKTVQTNYNKISSFGDFKRLNNEVTIHNTNNMELSPESISKVLNQSDNIEQTTPQNYEENQPINFDTFRNVHVDKTGYFNVNGRDEISLRKVKSNINDFVVNNKRSDRIEPPLLQSIKNNIFGSMNSCN